LKGWRSLKGLRGFTICNKHSLSSLSGFSGLSSFKHMVTPAILATTFEEFKEQLEKIAPFFDTAHIDVMDGVFVKNISFQEIEKILEMQSKLKFELHLMVEHPAEEMMRWKNVPNVFRALFHIETLDSPEECIELAKEHKWECGLVLNPETKLERAESYFNLIDVVQFMTVNPGQQGAPFVPEVLGKIKRFTALKKRPLCAVDGQCKICQS
jgi:ribulose-phosphate 3-epimerase